MSDSEVIDMVGYLLSSFAVGYVIGFLNVHMFKLLDQI